MNKRIVIIQGHPDSDSGHFADALVKRYEAGALAAGHEVRTLNVRSLNLPCLRSQKEWFEGTRNEAVAKAQEDIRWANHLLVVYPLWLGTMPAALKAFWEQVLRPGFAFTQSEHHLWQKKLKGRSCRIVITMGMPGFFYRWFYRAHSLKSLERNILSFVGIGPVKHTLIGMIDNNRNQRLERYLAKIERFGGAGM